MSSFFARDVSNLRSVYNISPIKNISQTLCSLWSKHSEDPWKILWRSSENIHLKFMLFFFAGDVMSVISSMFLIYLLSKIQVKHYVEWDQNILKIPRRSSENVCLMLMFSLWQGWRQTSVIIVKHLNGRNVKCDHIILKILGRFQKDELRRIREYIYFFV